MTYASRIEPAVPIGPGIGTLVRLPNRPSSARWYVIQTQPSKERIVSTNLKRQGFRQFMPEVARVTRHARSTRRVVRPLFPGYLFVSLDLTRDRWRSVQGTLGVSSMIMEGERPRPVPHGLVERLMEATHGAGALAFEAPLTVGSHVMFVTGPFADQLGQLVEMNDGDRVGVLLDMLGAKRTVTAPRDSLISRRF